MKWLRPVALVLSPLLFVVAFSGCMGPGGISSASTQTALDGPLGVELRTGGDLVGEGATWTLTVTHDGGPGSPPITYGSGCEAPLTIRLAPAEEQEAGTFAGLDAYWNASTTGEDLVWRQPTECSDGPITQELEVGESANAIWEWDATVWDASSESYEDVPAGTYAWYVTWHGRQQDTEVDEPVAAEVVQVFTFER